jgi:hypothetical protein
MSETKRYFGNWGDYESMTADFLQGEYSYEKKAYEPRDIPDSFPKDEEVLFAGYVYESYEGSSLVIWTRDGEVYMDEGGHCSCNGLEGSFGAPDVTKTTWEALALIDEKSSYRLERFGEEAQEAFKALVYAHAPNAATKN